MLYHLSIYNFFSVTLRVNCRYPACPFTLKYFRVYFLGTWTLFYINTVQLSKPIHFTLVQYCSSPQTLLIFSPVIPVMTFVVHFIPMQGHSREVYTTVCCHVSVVSLIKKMFLSFSLFFWPAFLKRTAQKFCRMCLSLDYFQCFFMIR